MFSGRISDSENFRLELEQRIETAKSLINCASAQGRDARDIQTVDAHLFAALKTLDRHGPIEAEPVEALADPRAAISGMVSAVLTVAGAMQQAITATEFVTLKIEAAALRPELADLIERLYGIDAALRVIVAAMPKTNVLAPPLEVRAEKAFEVIPSTAVKWMQAFRTEGRPRPKPHAGGRKLPPDAHAGWLKERVADQSDMTLLELCAKLAARSVVTSKSAVSRFFERIDFGFQKKRAGPRAGASGRGRSTRSLVSGAAPARSQKPGVHR